MANPISLIRAAALAPAIRWMEANGRPVQDRLRAADMTFVAKTSPELPVPLIGACEVFRIMAMHEGPDIGARMVTQDSLADLGTFGRVILGSRTPRNALERAAAALPRYSTHELLAIQPVHGGICVRAGWSLVLDDEILHLTQQFTAMMVLSLCAATGHRAAAARSIRIRPHPVFGLDHLRPWFGTALGPACGATLDIELDDCVLDAPLPFSAAELGPAALADWDVLKGDASFSHSARLVLEVMVDDPPASVERLATAARMSTRSVQRALTAEGTSFRLLLDASRRARALGALSAGKASGSAVAADLGYAKQSSLTRAVRRWTGVPPTRLAAAKQAWTTDVSD